MAEKKIEILMAVAGAAEAAAEIRRVADASEDASRAATEAPAQDTGRAGAMEDMAEKTKAATEAILVRTTGTATASGDVILKYAKAVWLRAPSAL